MIEFLNNKNCFKLVCAAGNEDTSDVEKLVFVYAKAGVKFFDLCAKKEIIEAARNGVKKANIDSDEVFYCVSLGIKGDPHLSKVKVDNDKCIKCFKCSKGCPNGAIQNSEYPIIKEERCIGCGACLVKCRYGALSRYSKEINFKEVLHSINDLKIDCIEFHAISDDDEDVLSKWELINRNYDGILSICVDRSKLSDISLVNRLKKMVEIRKHYSTIIQADGVPMSGTADDYKTTLQAIATAQIVQRANLPVHLLISGGTNSKTPQLAHMCEIDYTGIAVGSYARMIIKEHVSRNDFWDNSDIQQKAVDVAKSFVKELTKGK